MESILLYGASGHAKVIISLLESNNVSINSFFDDNIDIKEFNGFNVIGGYDSQYQKELKLIISIGDNFARKKISNIINHSFSKVFHKSSQIDERSFINIGTVVMHNSVIQSGASIGKHCIINTNAIIEHDCFIYDFVHISPSVTLCGNVFVGEGTHIGAGSTVIPNIKIGKWCVIGAGAVITKDVPDYSLVVGVPGKIIKKLAV